MPGKVRTFSSDKELVNARRGQIIKNATKVLVEKGFARTSIRDVARACHMSMGTLYHYVGSKEDVLYLVLGDELSRTTAYFNKQFGELGDMSPVEALRKYIELYYKLVDEIQDVVLSIHRDLVNLSPGYRRHLLELEGSSVTDLEALIRRGAEEGHFKTNDPKLVAHNIIVLGQTWALRRWFLREHYSLEEYIKEQTDFILEKLTVDRVSEHSR